MDNGNLSASDVALLTDRGGGFGGGWGDSSFLWIFALLILANGGFGWGNGGNGGSGGGRGGYGYDIYPWMNQANLTSDGFQSQLMNDNITSIRDGVYNLSTQLCNSFGNLSTQLCDGFGGVNMSINNAQNALAQQMYANQIADLERSFASQTATTQGMTNIQSQLAQCCCDNRLATNDLKYTIATENCADRAALSDGIRDILAAQTAGIQSIKDQLCQDKIDAKNDTIAQLRSELLYARGQASQDVQTAQILAGQIREIDGVYNRLRDCPVPTMPVYGQTPIFTCNGNNNGCGCGCGCGINV